MPPKRPSRNTQAGNSRATSSKIPVTKTALENQETNKATAKHVKDAAASTTPGESGNEPSEEEAAGGSKSKGKKKETVAGRMRRAEKRNAASIRSASPSGTGAPLANMEEELSGTRPPQYQVATPDPTTFYNEFNEPAEFSKMISQANNPDEPSTGDPAQSSFVEPWEPTQPVTSSFNPDARDEHVGAAEAARSSTMEAQDAYMSSLHRIQGSLLEAEAPRKEALDRANSLEKHCIGVATIAFAAPGGVHSLLEFKDGKVVARINLRDPEDRHVAALKEQLADSHKKTDFKTPIFIWAKEASVDPSIVDKMKKRDLYGVSEEVPILKIEMSPRENQIVHELYWTMSQPHLAPDYDPVRDRHLKPRWLSQDELNELAIELGHLREDRKFFILVNGQHRIVAMLDLAKDLASERMGILAAAKAKTVSQAELDSRIKRWSDGVRACTYRVLVFEANTPETLLFDWGSNTTQDPRKGEEQAELIWMTAQRYKAMIRNILLSKPGLDRRDALTAARIEYIRQTGVDNSVDSRPGAATNPIDIDAHVEPLVLAQGPQVNHQGSEAGDEGLDEPRPKGKKKRQQKKKSISGAAAVKPSGSHLSGISNGAAVFQRIMSFSPYLELVLSTCGAYPFWNNSVRDVHGTTMLRQTGAILAMHLWLDLEVLINISSASEIIVTPRIEAFVRRHKPKAGGYDEAVGIWESAFGRATSQPPGMACWAVIQERFNLEYNRHFNVNRVQDDNWLQESMWAGKNIVALRQIFYRLGAEPDLREGSEQDRLFGYMMQLYSLLPLAHKPLVADALKQGAPHSDTRPICPVPRFWPLAALPCKSRIAAYNRRAGSVAVPSGESIHVLTFLFGRNFPMWLYHGGIEKHTRLWSRWYEVNPGFHHVLLAGFEATGVGSLEARLSLVIGLIEDSELFKSMFSIEGILKEENLSLGQIMQECAVLSSHRTSNGGIKKGADGHFADALRQSNVDMTLDEALEAWKVAVPRVQTYLEEVNSRVSDLLKANPVLEIISRRFWDHTQLRRWAGGAPDGHPKTFIAERALAWGICLDYYERVVIQECLLRHPEMRTIIEFAEKISSLSESAPWFSGLFDTATLSQLSIPDPVRSSSPERQPSLRPDPPVEPIQGSQPAQLPPPSPRNDDAPGPLLRPLPPLSYVEPDNEDEDDEDDPPLKGRSPAEEGSVTGKQAPRKKAEKAVKPSTQVSVVLPTLSQLLKAQKLAQQLEGPAPTSEQQPGSRAVTPAPRNPSPDPQRLDMEVDVDRPDLSLTMDPPPDLESGDPAQSDAPEEDAKMDSSPRTAPSQLPSAASLLNTNPEVKEQLAGDDMEPFNMCEMVLACLPHEFSCVPTLSTKLMHTLDGLYLQQRSQLPVEKEDNHFLLAMEDMFIRMNAGSECIWAARARLREELLNFGHYVARSAYPLQIIVNQSASEACNICVRFMLQLIQDFAAATDVTQDESTSEIAWMVKTDGLFDNMIFYVNYNREEQRIELWLNLKHTFPLLLQEHLDIEEEAVVIRGFAKSNVSIEELQKIHQIGGTAHPLGGMGANEQERIYRSNLALQTYAITHGQRRHEVYVRQRVNITTAPPSFIADMGLQLSALEPGDSLMHGPDRRFDVVKIPEHHLKIRLMQNKLSPWSIGIFVLGGEFRDSESEGWKRRDVVIRGPNDESGRLLKARRNEVAQELGAAWEEQSATHVNEYTSWIERNHLCARASSNILPRRARYYNKQREMVEDERSRRQASDELPRGRPLFMPRSSVDPESDSPDDPELLGSPPDDDDPAPPTEPKLPHSSSPVESESAELPDTQETAPVKPTNVLQKFGMSNLALSQRPGILGVPLGLLPSTSTAAASRTTSGVSYGRSGTRIMPPPEVPDEDEDEEAGSDPDSDDDIQDAEQGTVSPLAGRQRQRRKRDRESIATVSSAGASAKAKKKARKASGKDEDDIDMGSG